MLTNDKPHICICICTYKRLELLTHLLNRLGAQRTDGLFTYSIVVADNDREESAAPIVSDFALRSTLCVRYCVEPRQNIALTRNKALENATGELIAFIDDDEVPENDWLYQLFDTLSIYKSEGVLGPVESCFEAEPPRWLKEGRFLDRPTHATGCRLSSSDTRSGNVLFKRDIVNLIDGPFRPQFRAAGEDVDFFRRLMDRGCVFVWCNEAVVHELVPLRRCTRKYLLRRAAIRGGSSPERTGRRVTDATRSLIAVPSYLLSLPVVAAFGQRALFTAVLKLVYHVSRLFGFMGLTLVRREI
jgi:glycosyltransferase involved in cell wall biosynthesis